MPISIYTDVVSVFETSDMVRLGEKYGATGQQMCVGLDVASRKIIESLAARAQTMDGAEQVFRKVGEFKGDIAEKFEAGFNLDETDAVVLLGTGSLTSTVHSDFDAIVNAVKEEATASHVASANIVGLTSALIMDFLGRYRKKFGLKRDNLTEILRTQKELTVEPPNLDQSTSNTDVLRQNLGLAPSTIEASNTAEPIVGASTTENVFVEEVRDKTPTEMAMAVANEAVAMKKAKEAGRAQHVAVEPKPEPKKKVRTAPRVKKIKKPRVRRSKKWLVAVPLLLIAGGGLFAWERFQESISASGVVASVSKTLTSFRSPAPASEADPKKVSPVESTATHAHSMVGSKARGTTDSEPSGSSKPHKLAIDSLASMRISPASGPIAFATNSIRKPTINAKFANIPIAKTRTAAAKHTWVGSADTTLLSDVAVQTPFEMQMRAASLDATSSVLTPKTRLKKHHRQSARVRNDVTIAGDDWLARSFLAEIAKKKSQKSYWWDEAKTSVKDGYIRIGPWQVTARPRNTSRSTYFTYQ